MDAAWKVIEDFRADWCSDPCYQRAGCGCADAIQGVIDAAITAEREACAKVADDFAHRVAKEGSISRAQAAEQIARTIRIRGRNR
jgi:hypothetical protein